MTSLSWSSLGLLAQSITLVPPQSMGGVPRHAQPQRTFPAFPCSKHPGVPSSSFQASWLSLQCRSFNSCRGSGKQPWTASLLAMCPSHVGHVQFCLHEGNHNIKVWIPLFPWQHTHCHVMCAWFVLILWNCPRTLYLAARYVMVDENKPYRVVLIKLFERKCQNSVMCYNAISQFWEISREVTRHGPWGRVTTIVHEKSVLAIGRKRHIDGSFRMLRKLFSLACIVRSRFLWGVTSCKCWSERNKS